MHAETLKQNLNSHKSPFLARIFEQWMKIHEFETWQKSTTTIKTQSKWNTFEKKLVFQFLNLPGHEMLGRFDVLEGLMCWCVCVSHLSYIKKTRASKARWNKTFHHFCSTKQWGWKTLFNFWPWCLEPSPFVHRSCTSESTLLSKIPTPGNSAGDFFRGGENVTRTQRLICDQPKKGNLEEVSTSRTN